VSKFGTSQSVPRKEDVRFLTGQGRYLDDAMPDGALQVVFFRSPVAHARITGLDVGDAAAAPGVVAVYTAADFEGRMRNAMDFSTVKNRDGTRGAAPRRPILADDRVCYAGEAIAMVVAETRSAALDAAEMIVCDFEDLPVHVATAEGGPTIHPEAPDNIGYDWAFGDESEVAQTFDAAAHTTRLELIDNRVMANPMETRGAFAVWEDDRLHVGYSGQGVWGLKDELAEKFDLPATAIRVTTPDVGGGFGIKGFAYPEYFAVAFAARSLGRPAPR
jgi:carbon-monoxide dehydrogenase large subunit